MSAADLLRGSEIADCLRLRQDVYAVDGREGVERRHYVALLDKQRVDGSGLAGHTHDPSELMVTKQSVSG